MASLPQTTSSLLVRTAEGTDRAWRDLVRLVETPTVDGFLAMVEFVDDPRWFGCGEDAVAAAVPQGNREFTSLLLIADAQTLPYPEFPILLKDLNNEEPSFRCAAVHLWGPENNLNLANMDWAEFVGALDPDGIFRANWAS